MLRVSRRFIFCYICCRNPATQFSIAIGSARYSPSVQVVGLASNPVVFCDPDGRIRGLAALVVAGAVLLCRPLFILTRVETGAPYGGAAQFNSGAIRPQPYRRARP